MTFEKIGEILGEPLCATAHKQKDYWYRRGFDKINPSWLGNDYSIRNLDLEKKCVRFAREDKYGLPVNIQEVFISGRIPPNAKAEVGNFLKSIRKKYCI